MKSGNIIILNGTSSAGKTTLAKAIQNTLDDYYVHTGIDHFSDKMPPHSFRMTSNPDAISTDKICFLLDPETEHVVSIHPGDPGYAMLGGMYGAAKALATNGLNVIIDDVIVDQHSLQIMVDTLVDMPTRLVNVFCPKEEAIRREKARGDRQMGMVEAQFDIVHAHGQYDLIVNTVEQNTDTCVTAIQDMLNQPPDALKRLKAQFAT